MLMDGCHLGGDWPSAGLPSSPTWIDFADARVPFGCSFCDSSSRTTLRVRGLVVSPGNSGVMPFGTR